MCVAHTGPFAAASRSHRFCASTGPVWPATVSLWERAVPAKRLVLPVGAPAAHAILHKRPADAPV